MLMWIAASAILAPLTLGGFEVTASGEPGQSLAHGVAGSAKASPRQRLERSIEVLVPTYVGLTLALTVCLLVAGDPPLVALSHAMSVLATSGISPIGGTVGAPSGIWGELVLFGFLFFALSRLTFSSDTSQAARTGLYYDPEFRLGLAIVAVVPVALFLRHWLGAFDVGGEENLLFALRALWGALFTGLSFLTTTGFVSGDWAEAQSWSGLSTPGIILMALALVGGGVATTAGGVKLLRVFALAANGKREVERLVYPSSVGRAGLVGRRIRREGAFIAWVFFMLFAVCFAVLTMLFGLYGIGFEPAVTLSIAALTNTGPLIGMASVNPVDLVALPDGAKIILSAAMVLGRLELLAIIVLLSPEIWRQ
jgi:trk system potassium uptake protein TrkH